MNLGKIISCLIFKGGSLSDFFRIIIFKIIVVKNLSMVGRTFESVLGPPGHMGSMGPSGHYGPSKVNFLIVVQNHYSGYYICRSQFPDRKGTQFFKIQQKMTELWPVKNGLWGQYFGHNVVKFQNFMTNPFLIDKYT